MFFNIFRSKAPSKRKHSASEEGFHNLVTGIKAYAIDDVPNKVAVLLVLSVVDLTVRVLLNVALALSGLSETPTNTATLLQRVESKRVKTPSPEIIEPSGRRSVHSRPVGGGSISLMSDDSSTICDESMPQEEVGRPSFSFERLDDLVADLPCQDVLGSPQPSIGQESKSTTMLDAVPEHELLKGFVKTSSTEVPPRPVRRHARHISLDGRSCSPDLSMWRPDPRPYNPPSPFVHVQEGPEQDTTDCTDAETVERMDSSTSVQESEIDLKEQKKEKEIETEILKEFETTLKPVAAQEVEPVYCESPCSSPRSVFSDSAAAKFVNSNFCNPEFCEDPIDMANSPPCGGSIRQRYTMKRLQSLMSQRSRCTAQTPSLDGRSSWGRPPKTPQQQESLRSFRKPSFRGASFCSRAGDEEGQYTLSDAYRMVKLESRIRKAWKISMDDTQVIGGGQSFRERESDGKHSPVLKSFRKMNSRRFDRAQRISFVKVPAFSNEMLMSRKQMLLNPAFGDEENQAFNETDSVLFGTEDETAMDASSVVMRTPLRRLGSVRESFKKCEKNFEEGTYDNPLRLCSFRSYDSDTELELTSVRVRNPISRLLSFRVHPGGHKDCIPLANIDSDEDGARMFNKKSAHTIRDGMLEKYLTQLIIDDTLDAHLTEDVSFNDDEAYPGWSSCHQEWVPQELDDRLKCLLLDRFLLDNVLNEVDANPDALLSVNPEQRTPSPRPVRARQLRRS